MSKSDTIDGGWFILLCSGPPNRADGARSGKKVNRGSFLLTLISFKLRYHSALESLSIWEFYFYLQVSFSFSLENRSCLSRWDSSSLSHTHSASEFMMMVVMFTRFSLWWFSPRLHTSSRFSAAIFLFGGHPNGRWSGLRREEFFKHEPLAPEYDADKRWLTMSRGALAVKRTRIW